MAAIDSLLSLIDAQQATGVVLRVRESPVLIGGKGRLTMPPLDHETIGIFAEEVLTSEERNNLQVAGTCKSVYRSERHGSFIVEARLNGDNLSFKLVRGSANLTKPISGAAPLGRVGDELIRPSCAMPVAEPRPTAPKSTPHPNLARAATDAPNAGRLAAQISRAVNDAVCDIVISAGQPLWVRSSAGLTPVSAGVVEDVDIRAFVDSAVDPKRRRALDEDGSVDFAWETVAADGDGMQRFRVNVFVQAHGLAAALRPVKRQAPSFA